MLRTRPFCLLAAMLALAGSPAGAGELTESDYFTTLPTVLTVTRLAQPLSETPGAVTIIDRETIRRSGARELTDLLRLVPGYLVGGWNGANPGAAYHAPLDDYGTRNLVLIDGRSVYSSFFLGDTHRGLMGLALEDIERIEVLRGSNSAAYGANALFGVINIVTRHSFDTQGAAISLAGGEGGINDRYVRYGWGSAEASHRLSAERRKDRGYAHAYDDKLHQQLSYRGDLRVADGTDLMLTAGWRQLDAGDGFPGDIDNPERLVTWRGFHVGATLRHQLRNGDGVQLRVTYDEELGRDKFLYPAPFSVMVDFGGRGRRFDAEFQHESVWSPGVRTVWGAGYKYEDARSQPMFFVRDTVALNEARLFGTLEWQVHDKWLANAGGYYGKHSRKGSYFMPRLAVNFLPSPDHSIRLVATESQRMPNLYELAADRRYYPAVLAPFFPNDFLWFDAASGNVEPERLRTNELGYFGNFRRWNLTLDIRAYHERMIGVIKTKDRVVPGYTNPLDPTMLPNDFANAGNLTIHGIEYQLRWKPRSGTEIWLNQNDQKTAWDDGWKNHLPPSRTLSVALFQDLPWGMKFSLVNSVVNPMTWRDPARALPKQRRTDIRLAYPFRVGGTRAEFALLVHSAEGSYVASFPYKNRTPLRQERRAFGTLRVEF